MFSVPTHNSSKGALPARSYQSQNGYGELIIINTPSRTRVAPYRDAGTQSLANLSVPSCTTPTYRAHTRPNCVGCSYPCNKVTRIVGQHTCVYWRIRPVNCVCSCKRL